MSLKLVIISIFLPLNVICLGFGSRSDGPQGQIETYFKRMLNILYKNCQIRYLLAYNDILEIFADSNGFVEYGEKACAMVPRSLMNVTDPVSRIIYLTWKCKVLYFLWKYWNHIMEESNAFIWTWKLFCFFMYYCWKP